MQCTFLVTFLPTLFVFYLFICIIILCKSLTVSYLVKVILRFILEAKQL